VAEEGASSRCRWLFESTERQTGSPPVSLSNSHDAMEQDETARDEGVRWRETLLPRLGRRYQMNRYGNMGGRNIDLG